MYNRSIGLSNSDIGTGPDQYCCTHTEWHTPSPPSAIGEKKKSSRLSQRLDLLLTSSSISLFSSISSSCLFTSSSTVFLYLQYESSLIPFFPSPSSRVLLHRHHADVCMPLRGYGCWLCIVYLLSLGLKIPRRNTSALSLFISLTVNGLIRLSKRLPGGWPPT